MIDSLSVCNFFDYLWGCLFKNLFVCVSPTLCLCVWVCLCLCLFTVFVCFPLRMVGGWVPGGGGVPSSFCAQSPKTDCGRKAFSQYCRQPAKRPTKARGIKILTELGSGAHQKLWYSMIPNISQRQDFPLSSVPELKTFWNFFGWNICFCHFSPRPLDGCRWFIGSLVWWLKLKFQSLFWR